MHSWMIRLMNTYVRNVRFSYIRLYPWVYNASIALSGGGCWWFVAVCWRCVGGVGVVINKNENLFFVFIDDLLLIAIIRDGFHAFFDFFDDFFFGLLKCRW